MPVFRQCSIAITALITVMLAVGSASAQKAVGSDFKSVEASREKAVLVLRIDAPPRNTVSKATLAEIDRGLDAVLADDAIGAIVITGSDQIFSAGAGGESLKKPTDGEATHAVLAHKLFNRIEAFPKPVIAAVSGISAGGGNELAMSCDIRIAGRSAKFRQHELQAGLIPGFGGMQRLSRLVGRGRAMELMLTGRFFDANEALSIGFVSSVVADAEVLASAVALGQTLAENLDRSALAKFKSRMAASYDEAYETALRNDQVMFDKIAQSEDARQAIQRFIAKQRAKSDAK